MFDVSRSDDAISAWHRIGRVVEVLWLGLAPI
jgi:hypothetical protein